MDPLGLELLKHMSFDQLLDLREFQQSCSGGPFKRDTTVESDDVICKLECMGWHLASVGLPVCEFLAVLGTMQKNAHHNILTTVCNSTK